MLNIWVAKTSHHIATMDHRCRQRHQLADDVEMCLVYCHTNDE